MNLTRLSVLFEKRLKHSRAKREDARDQQDTDDHFGDVAIVIVRRGEEAVDGFARFHVTAAFARVVPDLVLPGLLPEHQSLAPNGPATS